MNDRKTYSCRGDDRLSKLNIDLDAPDDLTIVINEKEYDLKRIMEQIIAVIGAIPCEK